MRLKELLLGIAAAQEGSRKYRRTTMTDQHACPHCGQSTSGSYSEGGLKWAICVTCMTSAQKAAAEALAEFAEQQGRPTAKDYWRSAHITVHVARDCIEPGHEVEDWGHIQETLEVVFAVFKEGQKKIGGVASTSSSWSGWGRRRRRDLGQRIFSTCRVQASSARR